MRVDLTKWLLIGPRLERESFFEKAQEAGLIEFISKSQEVEHFSREELQLVEALKILGEQPSGSAVSFHLSAMQAAHSCLEASLEIQRASDRLVELKKEKQHLEPLGNFSLEQLQQLTAATGSVFHFLYSERSQKQSEAAFEAGLFELGTREGASYFLWIGPGDQSIPQEFHVMAIALDPSQIQEQINEQLDRISKAEQELSACKPYERAIKQQLVQMIDERALSKAIHSSQEGLDQRLFICEGWVASSKEKELENLLKDFQILRMPLGQSEGESMPTHLENGPLGKIGADLVGIYDVPAGDDKDPSLWVLVFFAIFFGMIIGDGGYGLIFLSGTLYSYYRMKKAKGIVVRLRKLALILSVSCIIWGYLTCSFFGMEFLPTGAFKRSSLIHQISLAKARYHWKVRDDTYHEMVQKAPALKDLDPADPQKILELGTVQVDGHVSYFVASSFADQILREFSLFMGALHIILSLARYLRRNWAHLGWILFIIGGWLYFPGIVKAITFVNYLLGVSPELCHAWGDELVYAGIGLAVAISCFKNGWKGLLDLMTAVGVFADAMSYLRLYALGLSGAIMGATFNQLAQGTGLVVGTFILVCGHVVNIGLNIMSGVIHGLRLNFLEWYHYSFSGGGKWHRPLKKIDLNESSLP